MATATRIVSKQSLCLTGVSVEYQRALRPGPPCSTIELHDERGPCIAARHARLLGEDLTPIVILRLRNMTAIDATGLKAIEDFADALHASGRTLILCGALPQPARLMERAEFHRHVGAENIVPNVDSALERARKVHENQAGYYAGRR